ncbi:hypothetical protein JRO89_XS07G0282400 [Xanthoceras sorbifolium]|uniref:DUF6821 domain-containing protein n=1 Tax=Xanthoceras sorbifolium TaxID=99658 RepID=A0ABQ8HVM2_9ROSI|nr:hypothetical protein JRO89_XS07G0282400 [Xanthoceras sorbifolium]
MEGAGAGENFQDWEVLHSSDSESDSKLVNTDRPVENLRNFDEIQGDYSEGMIRSDYFSLDNENRYAKTGVVVDVSEEGSVESDNPSWIDPGSEIRYQRKNSGEFWSDSGSDRSDERKLGEFQVGCEGVGETVPKSDGLMKISGFDGILREHGTDSGRFYSDSGVEKESEMSIDDHVMKHDESEIICGESDDGNVSVEANSSVASEKTEAVYKSVVGGEEDGKERIAWWKVPFEVLKYCVLKVNPVWSFSVAAAVMGLVILGRRLYKMKRKTRSLELKVTLDDKVLDEIVQPIKLKEVVGSINKVSQFMSRAARLNEAFSVVRRVPIIRPALPAPGVNSWPVMSFR